MTPIERVQSHLAKRTGRRGFLRLAARVTAWISGTTLGVVLMSNHAAAIWQYACCWFPDAHGFCGTCPNCPAGEQNIYNWNCCYNNCTWTCLDCVDNHCSCGINNGTSCGGGRCAGFGPTG